MVDLYVKWAHFGMVCLGILVHFGMYLGIWVHFGMVGLGILVHFGMLRLGLLAHFGMAALRLLPFWGLKSSLLEGLQCLCRLTPQNSTSPLNFPC